MLTNKKEVYLNINKLILVGFLASVCAMKKNQQQVPNQGAQTNTGSMLVPAAGKTAMNNLFDRLKDSAKELHGSTEASFRTNMMMDR